jgi:cyclophilin family peptidyl-prolyl cis-trans isomerase
VQNFLAYVRSGHYEKTVFHQVEPGHVVLGGGRTAELTEKPHLMAIRNEADNGLTNRRGTVAMFRDPAIIDSATSEFFINLNDNPHFDYQAGAAKPFANVVDGVGPSRPEDYGFCVFGEVVNGMEVVEKMANAPVTSTAQFPSMPVEPIAIRAARRIR